MALLRANSRVPVQNEGDLYALIACCEVGEERLAAMMEEFGLDSLDALADHIVHESREATVARARRLAARRMASRNDDRRLRLRDSHPRRRSPSVRAA